MKKNIENYVFVKQNFLDNDTYKGIHNAIIRERKKINLHDANKIWDKNLTNNLSSPKRVEVSNYPPFEKLKTLVKKLQK